MDLNDLAKWGINLNTLMMVIIGYFIRQWITDLKGILSKMEKSQALLATKLQDHMLDDENRLSTLEATSHERRD